MAVVFPLLLLDATMRPACSGQLLMLLIDNMKVLRGWGEWRERFGGGHGDHEGHTCCYSFKVKRELGSLQTGAGGTRRRNVGRDRQTHSCVG